MVPSTASLRIALLSIGSELLDGRVTDSNATLIGGLLRAQGYKLATVDVIPDDLFQIDTALRRLISCSDVVLVSGGLGPTADDLTRDAVSQVLGQELLLRKDWLTHMRELFSKRQRPFDPSNERQAYIPKESELIWNPVGTAPGFIGTAPSKALVIALPGVPAELEAMFTQSVLPRILKQANRQTSRAQWLLRVFGRTEAAIGSAVVGCTLPSTLEISYRAHFPEVHVLFSAEEETLGQSQRLAREAGDTARSAIGSEFVYSERSDQAMQQVVHELLLERRKKVAVAESCTGGMLGMLLTESAGSSQTFLGGVVSYSNEVKIKSLGVEPEALNSHGAVSALVAEQMAQGVRRLTAADYALAITGVAGPEGGSAEKPVGTYFVGLATPTRVFTRSYFHSSSRDKIRLYACWSALDLLRRELLGI